MLVHLHTYVYYIFVVSLCVYAAVLCEMSAIQELVKFECKYYGQSLFLNLAVPSLSVSRVLETLPIGRSLPSE